MTTFQSLGELGSWMQANPGVRIVDAGIPLSNYADVSGYGPVWDSQPSVRKVVDFIARNIAAIPIHCYERVSDTDRRRVTDDPLARLAAAPAPAPVTAYRFWHAILCDSLLYDRWCALKVGGNDGDTPLQLHRIPPRNVVFKVDGFDRVVKIVVYDGRGKATELEPERFVFDAGYSQTNAAGTAPIQTLKHLIDESREAVDYRREVWKRGARIDGVLERPAEAKWSSQEAHDRFVNQWRAFQSGGGREGGTPILEDGMTYKAVDAFHPRQTQDLEGRRLTDIEVASSYHIPPELVGAREGTYCLPAESLVTTLRGPKPIADVMAGDEVWSLVDGRLAAKRVTWSGQTGTLPLLTIKTQNRTLRCTGNHPVLVRRSVRIKPDKLRYRWEHAFVPASELTVGDIVVTLGELPDVGVLSAPTREVSEPFMEFYGLMVGDGSISARTVEVARASDAGHMDHYRAIIRDEFTRYPVGGAHRSGGCEMATPTLYERERSTRFCSVSAANELRDLGFRNGARAKTVPDWVFGLTPKMRLAFLRGYVDADGSVTKQGRIEFKAASPMLIEQLRHLCMGLGIPVTNISLVDRMVSLPGGSETRNELTCFVASDPGMNSLIGSNDPADAERLAGGQPWGRKTYSYPLHGKVPIEPPGGCAHARVVSIESGCAPVPVYDITVDGSHNFVADGVIVHNSNIDAFRQMLYRTALGPYIAARDQVLNAAFTVDSDFYFETNIEGALRGSFEEQAKILQTATGGPYMLRSEARGVMNLPFVEGTDELIVPMNVTEGGQASPTDAGTQNES